MLNNKGLSLYLKGLQELSATQELDNNSREDNNNKFSAANLALDYIDKTITKY